MAITVELPALGESVVEGTITKWFVKEGDRVERDQPLVEVSTDKVDAEIPAPEAGVIERILAPEGETVPVGAALVTISTGAAADASPKPVAAKQAEPKARKARRADEGRGRGSAGAPRDAGCEARRRGSRRRSARRRSDGRRRSRDEGRRRARRRGRRRTGGGATAGSARADPSRSASAVPAISRPISPTRCRRAIASFR